MAAIRRTALTNAPDDDTLDQQTLLQQLTGQPSTSLPSGERVTDPEAQSPLANNPNTGVAGDLSKSISDVDALSPNAPKMAGNSAWDTDGYAAPAYTATDFGGPMAGWDATKWADPNNQHPKYVVGRILSKYAPDDAGTQAAVQEIMKAYPGTTFDGKDKITVPGLGTIDFRKGAGAGGTGWQWDDLSQGGAMPGAAPAAPTLGPSTSINNALTSGSTYQELMKRLQAILGTSAPDQMDQQTLLAQLGQ